MADCILFQAIVPPLVLTLIDRTPNLKKILKGKTFGGFNKCKFSVPNSVVATN